MHLHPHGAWKSKCLTCWKELLDKSPPPAKGGDRRTRWLPAAGGTKQHRRRRWGLGAKTAPEVSGAPAKPSAISDSHRSEIPTSTGWGAHLGASLRNSGGNKGGTTSAGPETQPKKSSGDSFLEAAVPKLCNKSRARRLTCPRAALPT